MFYTSLAAMYFNFILDLIFLQHVHLNPLTISSSNHHGDLTGTNFLSFGCHLTTESTCCLWTWQFVEPGRSPAFGTLQSCPSLYSTPKLPNFSCVHAIIFLICIFQYYIIYDINNIYIYIYIKLSVYIHTYI